MKQDNQDGVASIPQFYRNWIIKTYGLYTLSELDRLGAKHDLSIGKLGWSKANSQFRLGMKGTVLPILSVRIPVSIGIFIYRWMPQKLKDCYNWLIS